MKKLIIQKEIQGTLKKIFILGPCTGFGLGYLPKAPGTFGSLLGIPLGLALLKIPLTQALLFCFLLNFLLIPLVEKARAHWGLSDPPEIVIDEIIGQAVAMLPLKYFIAQGELPPFYFILAAFLLFRLFDIWKPFPVSYFDRRCTSFGLLFDDFVAGLYAAFVIFGWIHFMNP